VDTDGSAVDYDEYLQATDSDGESSESDSEDESEVKPVGAAEGRAVDGDGTGAADGGGLVFFSDSSDGEDSNSEEMGNAAAAKVVQEAQNTQSSILPVQTQSSRAVRPPARKIPTARELLRQSLRKKVFTVAAENLCKQMKISSHQLALRTQVSEKCRYFRCFVCVCQCAGVLVTLCSFTHAGC
jgi:hypothetical protein